MHIAITQHMAHEGPGSIASWASERGHETDIRHLYRGDPLPDAEVLDLLIVLGGDMSVHDNTQHPWLPLERALISDALAKGKKVAGICLGAQQIAMTLGGSVYPHREREVGFWPIRRVADILPLPDTLSVLHWHGDTFDLPPGATLFAESEGCQNQMFLAADGRALGLQCHIETTAGMVEHFCREDAAYLIPPEGQGRWMQDACRMREETQAYPAMREALYALLDAFATKD
ncbi:MAG: type 1 glutamine amidotransferase [Pseudomonadota bacterium]